MSMRGFLATGVLVAVIAPLAYLTWKGGGSPSPGSGPPSVEVVDGQWRSPAAEPKKLLEGWAKPAVAVVLSGEQHGYLEPCGCSATQSGGLSRRADLFRKIIEERGWPVVAFDLGGTVRPHRENRSQTSYKFSTILDSLGDLHYAALGLGPEELRLGAVDLIQQANPDPDATDGRPPFLCANAVLFGDPEIGVPARRRIRTVGGVSIGTTAVLGKSIRDAVFPQGANTDIELRDPEQVLPEVLEEFQDQQVEFRILLSHAKLDESRALAEKFPEFDLVLSAGGPEDPDGKPEWIGETMLVTVGHKGKYVGVIGYYPDDAEQSLRFELVDLDSRRFQNSPAMDAHMRSYQGMLHDAYEQLIEELTIGSHPSGSTFVGAQKCGECHTRAYEKWKATRHSHAYESLIKGREGQQENWIARNHDPECLACHVTGWQPQEVLRYDSGFASKEKTPHLLGQQCENCHGPGSRHIKWEELWKNDRSGFKADDIEQRDAQRRAMHLTTAIAEQQLCYKCHDLDNSPNFNFQEYWEKVAHPWKD